LIEPLLPIERAAERDPAANSAGTNTPSIAARAVACASAVFA
jgi:hypothetical protein